MEAIKQPQQKDFGLLFFVGARLAGILLVAAALPFAHVMFGETYPGDGQQGFGILIQFGLIGVAAAFAYVVIATIGHFVVRKRSLRAKLWVEAIIFLVIFLALAYAGVTAHYRNT
jgi:hypothetical protein